jgi:hypothetical protein
MREQKLILKKKLIFLNFFFESENLSDLQQLSSKTKFQAAFNLSLSNREQLNNKNKTKQNKKNIIRLTILMFFGGKKKRINFFSILNFVRVSLDFAFFPPPPLIFY